MPILSGTRDIRGNTGYVYDISQDDIDTLVQEMLANADAPFTFIGRIGDVQQELTNPRHVGMTLARNGQVAATANVAGETVKIQFAGTNMNIIPESGIQSTADMLVGAGSMDYVDDDDFDPFASAADNFPVPDPRGRSQILADRYGDNEEDYYVTEELPGAGNTTGTGDEVVSISEWVLTLVLLAIPIVNLVVLILWLVSKKTKQSKKNYLKVQLVLSIIGGILAAGAVVGVLQMGILPAMLGQQVQQPSYTQTYDEDENALLDELDRRGDNVNTNENENSNGNMNENLDGNANAEGPASTVPEEVAGELKQTTNGTINVDNISRSTLDDGRDVAVVTITMFNTSPVEASPAALLDLSGNQGQNVLEFNLAAFPGFAPETFNMPIQPGVAGTFQVSLFLVDSQELTIRAANKETHEVILEASQLV